MLLSNCLGLHRRGNQAGWAGSGSGRVGLDQLVSGRVGFGSGIRSFIVGSLQVSGRIRPGWLSGHLMSGHFGFRISGCIRSGRVGYRVI
jgi:hypothetical protein